ncbi:MAG: 50S ribosomal protein L2 [Candidatus Verstraetearchaeota archaeon]|nr:50S ribosomal protein L2 [Candidatus Verstraetearchaeota archaeon]
MGKRLLVQRRGRGGSVFISPRWKKVGAAKYPPIKDAEKEGSVKAVVKELLHDPGRGAPLAKVVFEDGSQCLMVAAEGMYIGQRIAFGASAPPTVGNVLPLKSIPEGSYIFNIEKLPGDGGKFVRSSGTYATILSHSRDKVVIQMPSGALKEFNPNCRATIGIVAGGGRIEKPFVKAGKKYHLSRAKAWKYPTVRGKAMSPYAHPHGGGSHPTGGRPVKRTAPPGQKVGHIAPKRTGRKKG